jgi:cell shape-determining protein MreC
MKTLAQAIKQYQKLNTQSHQLKKQIDKLYQEHQNLRNQRNQTQDQMKQVKNLIDLCVITGKSPTEVLLSNTAEQIESQLNDHMVDTGGFYTDSGYISINTSTVPMIASSTWSDSLVINNGGCRSNP